MLPRAITIALLAIVATACDDLAPPPFNGVGGDARTRDGADAVTLLGVCTPGDETFCNSNGRCDDEGGACVCFVPEHFSPDDACRNWHAAVLPVGQICVPEDREYCHWQGACAADGKACVCDVPDHFSPDDQCSWYHDHIDDPDLPLDPDRVCVAGDRDYCNSQGACAEDGKACVCDDPAHYTPSDACRDWHQDATEPLPGQVCVPSDRSGCNGHGACGEDGLGCVCDDPAHFTPDDACKEWHP
ncbi:MAG: hypothetical protein U1F43_11375 [Myxococcota bacterium]